MVTRRALPYSFLVALLPLLPAPVEAQLNFGVHVARAADVLGGAWGGGATVGLEVPLVPVGARVGGDWFRPDCGDADGCGFLGWTADVTVRMPFPVVRPYALGGVARRRFDSGAADPVWDTGWTAGLGIDVNPVLLRAYAELRYERVDPDPQIVLRLGVIL